MWFRKIKKSVEEMNADHSFICSINIDEAKKNAAFILSDVRFVSTFVDSQDIEKIVDSELADFFKVYGSVSDDLGEMEILIGASSKMKCVGDLGSVINLGGEGATTIFVYSQSNENFHVVYDYGTDWEEVETYPSVYHFIVFYARSIGIDTLQL